MNEYTFKDCKVGMTALFTREITDEMEESFRKLSGDENPLHKNDAFAIEVSNGKIEKHIVFGMLTASLYSTMAGMFLPGKYSLIHSFEEISFMNPVYTGDTLTVNGEITDIDEALHLIRIKVKITNQNNQKVSRARMKVLVMR